jgi:hypothetical protein
MQVMASPFLFHIPMMTCDTTVDISLECVPSSLSCCCLTFVQFQLTCIIAQHHGVSASGPSLSPRIYIARVTF